MNSYQLLKYLIYFLVIERAKRAKGERRERNENTIERAESEVERYIERSEAKWREKRTVFIYLKNLR